MKNGLHGYQCCYSHMTIRKSDIKHISPSTNGPLKRDADLIWLLNFLKNYMKQKCIPVGCVLTVAVAFSTCPPPPAAGTPGCGPGDPQMWAWNPPPVWAWRPPTLARCINFPFGCGPGNLQGMLGYHLQCILGYHPPPLPVDGMTETCKNITFANFICGR